MNLVDSPGWLEYFSGAENSERFASPLHDTSTLIVPVITLYRDEPIIEIVRPLQISMQPWGVLRLIYTLDILQKEIAASREQIRNEIKGMIYRSVLTALLFLGVCLLTHDILKEQVLAISEGKTFELQCVNRTLTGHSKSML